MAVETLGPGLHRGDDARVPRLPRPLPEPGTIGICSLSGRVDEQQLGLGVSHLKDLGHTVIVAPETLETWRYFAGTDDSRAQAFHDLVDNPAVDLVMAARGGYGLSRILHRIDWNRVAASGKAYVGFSDFTAFNMAALACANLVTFHGPMLTSDFGKEKPDSFTEQHFWMAVSKASHRIDDIDCEPGYDARRIDGTLWGGHL